MFLLVLILSLIIFLFLKDKLHLTITKSIIKLSVIGLILFVALIVNVIYNWDYFKQYSGDKTSNYYLAYSLWYVTSYGLLAIMTILISSIISNIKRKSKTYR